MNGWPEKDPLLVVGYVELNEGPRVMTNVRTVLGEVEVRVRVAVESVDTETDEAISLPVFARGRCQNAARTELVGFVRAPVGPSSGE